MPATMTVTAKSVLNLKEVALYMGVQPRTIIAWVESGTFPEPIRMSPRKLLWTVQAVEAALNGNQQAKTKK